MTFIEHSVTPSVRLLPYALVPGMLFTSPLFIKAVSTIAKQQSQGPISLPKEKKQVSPGMFILLKHIHSSWLYFLDPLSTFLKGSEISLVTRARDVVSNSVMAELAKDDPQGLSEYRDAVRHEVVSVFQRLRILSAVLDSLMEAYTASK